MTHSSITTTGPERGFASRAFGAAMQFLFMTEEIAAADQKSLRPGQPGYQECEIARSALDTARHIDDLPQRARGAVVILLEAINYAARGMAQRRKLLSDDEEMSSAWLRAAQEPDVEPTLRSLPSELRARVDRVVLDGLTTKVDVLSPNELVALRSTLSRIAAAMVEALERDVTLGFRARSERAMRWVAIGVAALALASWNYRSDIRSLMLPNLALHREVRISSNWRPGIYPATGVVDGETTELGCHSDFENHPWLQIDLGQSKTIHRVVVTNRVDGDTTRAVPLLVELSSDGKSFAPYARQDSDFKVWTAKGRVTRARFVRLTVQKDSMLHLNEVEVY